MYEYLQGKITEIKPSNLVLEVGGIGYFINISLNTFSKLKEKKEAKVYIHQVVREDALLLYGYAQKSEREIFRYLISVSGVGANTATVMLSSLSPGEVKKAVLTENENVLKSVKGIGAKTAKRIILDLKDKINKAETDDSQIAMPVNDTVEEASAALIMLGFNKKAIEKVVPKLQKEQPDISVENLVKTALKKL